MIHTSLFTLPKQLVRVWRNEFTRVICDRLSSEQVRWCSFVFFFFLAFLLLHFPTRSDNNSNAHCNEKLNGKTTNEIHGIPNENEPGNENVRDSFGVGFDFFFLSALICLCLFSRVAAFCTGDIDIQNVTETSEV